MDLESGKRHQITDFGVFPAWSPDGQYIAFSVYDGGELGIFVIPSTGGEPRKLAVGYQPVWSRDSRRLYYRMQDAAIGSVSLDQPDDEPVTVLRYPGRITSQFAISPDETRIAMDYKSEIRVLTFPEGEEVMRWRLPWPMMDWANELKWHPDGKTLVFASSSYYNQLGLSLRIFQRFLQFSLYVIV